MATDTTKILVGAATVSVGAYVTAGGAGTLVDVGHTKSPTTLAVTYEDFAVKSERAFGTLKKIPQDAAVKLKVSILESVLENWRVALRQPAGNLTGTPPNLTLQVGDPKEQYHQVTLAMPGVGTTGARLLTIWKAIIESVAELPVAKGAEQLLEVTLDCLYDDSVAAAGKFFKVVDA